MSGLAYAPGFGPASAPAAPEPRTLEEMTARRKAARARMEAAAERHARFPNTPVGLPAFARLAGPGGPYDWRDVIRAAADAFGPRGTPNFDGAAAYWLFAFTDLSAAETATAVGLADAAAAKTAMRAFAARAELPPIDLSDDTGTGT